MNGMQQKYTALISKAQRQDAAAVPQLELCFQMLSAAAAIDADCAARLSQHSLSEGKFVLLFLLHDEPQGLSPHQLADRAGVTRATVSGLLDGLEKSGLVVRHRDKEDRRSITIRLTTQGTRRIAMLFAQHTHWIRTLFDGFSKEEAAVLRGLLQRVWANTDTGNKAARSKADAVRPSETS